MDRQTTRKANDVADAAQDSRQKPATAARIYDYHLGGTHNFPADREAAKAITAMFPHVPAIARTNRALLRRVVRHLAAAGVEQFLDVGSGIPTEGNVHEVAPDARVVYVDIDPVAVAEGQEILEGNARAKAVRGDLLDPESIVAHSQVRAVLDFDRPVAVLLFAVLHFVTDTTQAQDVVRRLLSTVAPGSYLAISHAASEVDLGADLATAQGVYRKQTATPFAVRSRSEVQGFFEGLDLLDPGLVWLPEWRPEPEDPADFVAEPSRSGGLTGVARLT